MEERLPTFILRKRRWIEQYKVQEEVVKKATCTKNGKRLKTCEKCGVEEEEKIPASHDLKESARQPATCTTEGWAMMYCAREGCDYTTTKTFTKLGHSAGNDGYCMRDGCGVSLDEVEFGNDIADELCERLEDAEWSV